MTSPFPRDYVERRIVVEFGRMYAYAYLTDGNGKLIEEEPFKQPFRLDRQEAIEEARELWDMVYDHLNDSINFPSASEGDDEEQSE